MKPRPPQHILNFLRWFCKEEHLEEIEGDLTEIFERDYNCSARKARWRFAWNVLRYFRPAFVKSFSSGAKPDVGQGVENPSMNIRTNGMKLKKIIVPSIALAIALGFLVPFLYKALSVGKPKSQNPSLPLPYLAENVTFLSAGDEVKLAGTLTLPPGDGSYPAVILISGSGPQNRDEEILGHRPFLVLADHLTRNGVAVLRYDDRGTGQSKGNFMSASLDDFASDVKGALTYLRTRKEIDPEKIGLIGHGEGGMLAPLVATTSSGVSFIVMLAGPGIKITELSPLQNYHIAKAEGATDEDAEFFRDAASKVNEMVANYHDRQELKKVYAAFISANWDKIQEPNILPGELTESKYVNLSLKVLTSRRYTDILKYDPATVLQMVDCPVLALTGEMDPFVPPRENLAGIQEALTLGGNTQVTVKELPGLNHFFQECQTCSIKEFGELEQTFSPIALNEISEWIATVE